MSKVLKALVESKAKLAQGYYRFCPAHFYDEGEAVDTCIFKALRTKPRYFPLLKSHPKSQRAEISNTKIGSPVEMPVHLTNFLKTKSCLYQRRNRRPLTYCLFASAASNWHKPNLS